MCLVQRLKRVAKQMKKSPDQHVASPGFSLQSLIRQCKGVQAGAAIATSVGIGAGIAVGTTCRSLLSACLTRDQGAGPAGCSRTSKHGGHKGAPIQALFLGLVIFVRHSTLPCKCDQFSNKQLFSMKNYHETAIPQARDQEGQI